MDNYNNNDNNNNKDDDNNRILLVDDEVDITMVYTMGLQDNGFKVDAFNDPLQALSDFKSGSYNLALLDYKMPKMNGFELYQEIRKVDTKVKVCFITAFDVYHGDLKKEFHRNSNGKYQDKEEEDSDIIKCFIQKPIGIDELVKRVKEQLNS
jgi:two-component system catabolic regulation response regulator CreB/two-component system response regulator ChvI